MRTKMKLNLLRHKSIVAASFPRIVLILLASLVLHGCIRVSMVGLPEEVETAVTRSMFRHKAEIVERVRVGVGGFAPVELRQFNKAEQQYGNDVHFRSLLPPAANPMGLGVLWKSKRHFLSYEIVEVRDTGSLLHDPYEVIVGYKYVMLQTKIRESGDPRSMGKLREDSDFHETGEQGSLEFLYKFNTDLVWDGRPGIRLRKPPVLPPLAEPPVLPPLAEPPVASPATPAPGPSPPAQDLPVNIAPVGGGSGPPPATLQEGIRSSPLPKDPPRREDSPD